MDFNGIRDFICAKVGKADSYSKDRCMDFVKARHKMIYEAFDWKSAQIIVGKTLGGGAPAVVTQTLSLPEVHHVISVKVDDRMLEPVTASFIFEDSTSTSDKYNGPGDTLYYEEFFDIASATRSIQFFPPLVGPANVGNSVVVLGKKPYDESWTSPVIPGTESALEAFVLGDMWEYLHQVGKAQAKFQEANTLLATAHTNDAPAMRPRMSKQLTPTGNSLGELTDAVCGIIGDFAPMTRTLVKNRIRRNYQAGWDMAPWPETMIIASVTADDDVVTLPALVDKILSARVNIDLDTNSYRTLRYEDSTVFFDIRPEIFDITGTPVAYNTLLPSALPEALSSQTKLTIKSASGETVKVFVRGTLSGVELFETVAATHTGVNTVNYYDTVDTLSKPVTKGSVAVYDLDNNILLLLNATEQERKYPRLRVYPSFEHLADQTVFFLAKRKLPQLLDDGDTAQLSGIENYLIDASAADMLMKSDAATSAQLRSKSAAGLQVMVERETKQQGYAPRIIPYAEPDNGCWDNAFLNG